MNSGGPVYAFLIVWMILSALVLVVSEATS